MDKVFFANIWSRIRATGPRARAQGRILSIYLYWIYYYYTIILQQAIYISIYLYIDMYSISIWCSNGLRLFACLCVLVHLIPGSFPWRPFAPGPFPHLRRYRSFLWDWLICMYASIMIIPLEFGFLLRTSLYIISWHAFAPANSVHFSWREEYAKTQKILYQVMSAHACGSYCSVSYK